VWKDCSDVIGWRSARQTVETVEQAVAPQSYRIALFQQRERADAARPLERAEHGVVGVERLIAAKKQLRFQRQPQRRKTGAKRRQLVVAVGDERFERRPDAFLARFTEIAAILPGDVVCAIQEAFGANGQVSQANGGANGRTAP